MRNELMTESEATEWHVSVGTHAQQLRLLLCMLCMGGIRACVVRRKCWDTQAGRHVLKGLPMSTD